MANELHLPLPGSDQQARRRELPLEGINVVEFGDGLAAGLAGRLLAEQGAAVTRIEPPDARQRSGPDAPLHAGKQRLTLDLHSPTDSREAEALIAESHVLIEGFFRPGTMERRGLGPERAQALNPRLIYLRLPGFAAADPAWCDVPAAEGALGAASGLFTDVNILRGTLGLPPVYTALPHCSVYGAVHGALAVALALLAPGAPGVGELIEVPLAAAGAAAMGSAAMRIDPQPRRYDIPDLSRAVSRLLLPGLRALVGLLPRPIQRSLEAAAARLVPAVMDSYRCADGRLLYVFAADHDRFAVRLLRAAGLEGWARRQGGAARDPYRRGAGRDRRNLAEATRLAPPLQSALRGRLAAAFATAPAATWEAVLQAEDVPCSVQRSTAEWFAMPRLARAGIVTPEAGPGLSAWVQAGPGSEVPHDIPAAGQRLAGRLVLDLTSMVAGPVCARTLAEYGARVLRIDSPHPHHGPRLTCWFGVDVNQGKESLLLDLAEPRGRAVLEALLPQADALLHNFSAAACARLGLDAETLHQAHPGLLVANVGAWLGPEPGAWDDRKGYDPVLQAASGLMLRYGGRRPVLHGIASCVDYLCGYLAAWSVALGLLARRRGSLEVTATTSLAQAATLIQAPFAPGGPGGEPTGQWAWGANAFDRLYRARDGWVYLAAPPGEIGDVLAALGLDPSGPAHAATLARPIRRRTRAALRAALGCDRVALVPVDPLALLPDEAAAPAGSPVADAATIRAVVQTGPGGVRLRTLLPTYARARAAPLLHLPPAAKPGADTVRLLGECGCSDAEIEALLRDGVAATGLHPRLLPE